MAEENPAAKSPTPRANPPKGPMLSVKACAKSEKEEKDFTAVPATRMAAVMSPPMMTEMIRPMRISGTVWPLLMPEFKTIFCCSIRPNGSVYRMAD